MPTIRREDLPAAVAFRKGGGQQFIQDLAVGIRNGAAQALSVGGARAGVFSQSLARALQEDRIDRARMQRTHEELAAQARAATIRAYKSRTPRRRIPAYRKNVRIGYGMIERALSDGGHAGRSTAFLVDVFDFELLDRLTSLGGQGALWRQINYGALPSSGKTPKSYAVLLDNGGGFVLQLANNPVPAGVLRRPRGRWKDASGNFVPPSEGGDDRFVPRRRSAAVIPLKGSRATQFLDAAPRELQKRWGPAYTRMWNDVISSATRRTRLERGGLPVPKRQTNLKQPRFFTVRVT